MHHKQFTGFKDRRRVGQSHDASDHELFKPLRQGRDEQSPGGQNAKQTLSLVDDIKINNFLPNTFIANGVQGLLHCVFLTEFGEIFASMRQNRLFQVFKFLRHAPC